MDYFIYTASIYDDRNTWNKRRLVVFSFTNNDPKFESAEDQYIYSGPVFSSDGKYVAFAYAHDLRHSKYAPDPDESENELDAVNWDETVAIIDMHTWEVRNLFTKRNMSGYGEWSTPENFFDLTFIHHDTILFASRSSDWGIINIWNIPLDGSEPKIIYNPAWEQRDE